MAITTQDGLIAALGTGHRYQFYKGSVSVTAGGNFSLFRVGGTPGAAGIPGTAAGQTLSRTSTGAIPLDAPSGVSYFVGYAGMSTVSSSYTISDRLVETGTLSGTTTSAQTVSSVALPARASSSTDVELWLEIYTALGSTASPTVTASYTNQAGTSGHTATLIGGIPTSGGVANRSYQMSLQAGDTGVQSVQSVTSTTSTGTAGAFGVVLRRTLLWGIVPVTNLGWVQGYAETDLTVCPDDACLELGVLSNSAGSGSLNGYISVVQG